MRRIACPRGRDEVTCPTHRLSLRAYVCGNIAPIGWSTTMALLLASVTGPDEAALVLAGGADIIDLKDAARGALGARAPDVLRATVAAVGGRRPVSAVTGDLPMEPDVVTDAVARTAETGVDYVKVGLFPGPKRPQCIRTLAPLARSTKIVGVMFA